jgi:hypothetical protein
MSPAISSDQQKTRHGEFRNKEKSATRRAEQRGFVGFEMLPR